MERPPFESKSALTAVFCGCSCSIVFLNSRAVQALSYLTSITQRGCRRLPGGQYSLKSLPALEFEYQRLDWDTSIYTLGRSAQENLPSGAEGSYRWLDL